MTLTPDALERWTAALLRAAGLSDSDAERAGWVFARASERGLGHHDVSLLPQRLEWLQTGQVNPRPAWSPVVQLPTIEVWDADRSLGEVACHFAVERAVALAQSGSLAYVGVRHSNHFLAAEPYIEWARGHDVLVVIWSNTDAGMAVPGGSERRLGNNPLGWGLGHPDEGLSADLCMAEVSLGALGQMAEAHRPVPPHWGRGPDGEPAGDAESLRQGAVAPIGGPKGLSLALLGEVLTGVLTGGETLDQVMPPAGVNTHSQMILAFRLEAFAPLPEIQDRVKSLRHRLLKVGVERIPGERSRQSRLSAQEKGIILADSVARRLVEWSQRLGVAVP